MKLLHASDLHLGRDLLTVNRDEAHRAVCDTIIEKAEAHRCGLVVLAGDIFDTVNPPHAAERMYYDLLRSLTADNDRAVVVTAGNHDSPAKLAAAASLLQDRGVFVFSDPSEMDRDFSNAPFEATFANGVLNISNSFGKCALIPMPFVNESRLRIALPSLDSEAAESAQFSKLFASLVKERSDAAPTDVPLVLVTHQYFWEARMDKTERDISIGGTYAINIAHLPDRLSYIAAGHFHRRQRLAKRENAYYSGSPLALDFSKPGAQANAHGFIVYDLESYETTFEDVSDPHPPLLWRFYSLEELEKELRNRRTATCYCRSSSKGRSSRRAAGHCRNCTKAL
ncbi:MAG: exonuclease subunit SbcD [Planctomycetota bacterium]|nr:exonuclease subunit SbcD [Planctomycetota bacterium]